MAGIEKKTQKNLTDRAERRASGRFFIKIKLELAFFSY